MRHVLGACGLAAFAAAALAAETPEALVKQLGSPRYADRESASRELLKLGSAALPAVKAAAESSSDPEVRERAGALLDPLARTNDSSKLLAVKPVKLAYKATPLSAAIADFKTKTGILLTLVPGKVADAARPVTLAGEFTPWEGVEAFLKAAGLREDHRVELPGGARLVQANNYYNRRIINDDETNGNTAALYTPSTAPILLVDGTPDALPAVRSGAVRVTALPAAFAANRVIRGAGRVIIHLDVAPVPLASWHGANGVRVSLAEDEDGRPVFADLKLVQEPFSYGGYDGWNGGWGGGFGRRRAVFWGGGGMSWTDDGNNGPAANSNPRLTPVALRTNDRAVKSLRRFEGSVLGEVHTPNVPVVTVLDLERATGTSYSGPQQSSLQLQEVKKHENGTYTVKVRHESLTQWALQNLKGMGWNGGSNDNPGEILNRIKFYDAAGKALANPQHETTNYGGDGFRQSVDATLRFPKGVTPVKLIVTGTRITSVEVPFKLVNVSVP